MAQERVHKSKSVSKKEQEEVQELPAKNEDAEELKEEIDDLLDEIDSVLEENAEEFVNSYIQKGGE